MATIMYMADSSIKKIFGNNLERLIAREGFNQRQLAIKMNVDPSYINAIVKGRKYVSEGTLNNLCGILHAEPWEFYINVDTPIIIDNIERKILERMRSHPEIKPHCDIISRALVLEKGEQFQEHPAVQEEKPTKRKEA